jgi:Ca-activated chloride channel family protein
MGIQLAYDIAKANFVQGGVNRVILATDGDFNVGVTGEVELVRLIQEKAKSGVFLSVLGFGIGNVKDATLEQFADKGNGNYAYIDSLAEARKTLVEQAGGTLVTIAKDVKLQVEFNPAVVQAYRLIGYENRLLAKEDFNNDKVDAGEIGAGHTVTALYEIVPVGVAMEANIPTVDRLKYQLTENQKSRIENQESSHSGRDLSGRVAQQSEMLTVKIRYKEPAGDISSKLEFPLYDTGARFAEATQDFKFASAVAAFGMVLRDSPHRGSATLADVEAWGRAGIGSDAGGYRNEFLGLVERSKSLLQ